MIKKLAKWIPMHVSPVVIVAVYYILEKFNFIKKSVIEQHRRENEEHVRNMDNLFVDGYIEGQYLMKAIKYGRTNMAFAGCEVIATYNAMKSLGAEADIVELIAEYERHGATLRGFIGTAPTDIRRLLRKKGYDAKMLWKTEKISDDCKAFIVTYYNNKYDLYDQIHTVAVTKSDNDYSIHNIGRTARKCAAKDEVFKALGENSKVICIVTIK